MERRIVPDVIGQRQQLLEMPASATVRDAVRRMCERKVGAVLVTSDGALQGIFTERDLMHRVVASGRDPDATRLGEVMTADPDTVEADEHAVDALALMSGRGYRHLPVLEKGRLIGIVSRRDFLGEEIAIVEEELGHEQRF
ncbi:MAG: CBS domain-containing protein [Dongiaceae bacterium]